MVDGILNLKSEIMFMNKKYFCRVIALIAAAAVMLTGCGVDKVEQKSSEVSYPKNGIYPLKCNDTIQVWSTSLPENIGETPFGVEWQKKTGVDVEFIQPMNGSDEALSILLASGDLPDIIITNIYNEPGGVMRFVDDGVIVPITDYMDDYAPSLKKYLDENSDIDKMAKSDKDEYYSFPFIRGSEKLASSSGIVIRKDMLDKYGLSVPETIDEWHTVLTAFKNQGVASPLSYDLLYWEKYYGVFMGAYGTKADFYLKNGNAAYGYLEPEFKDGLNTLRQWYGEGLMDKNVVKIADLDSNILNSVTGASCVWAGNGIGKYLTAMKNKNSSFNLVPAPFPVINKGDRPKFGTKEKLLNVNNNAFITSNCKNIELAMRFLDYGYTDEGHMLFNFGIEGESYEIKNGNPVYTDLILHNSDGLSMSEIMKKYMLSMFSGPFVQDERYIDQYYRYRQQKDALNVWSKCDGDKNSIPIIYLTTEESDKISKIMNDVEKCADEMIFKFIMGIEPMDKYDDFIRQLKQMGIDEAIAIYDTAVKRAS